VKIETEDSSRGSSLEIISCPAQIGLTAGIYYSTLNKFEAVDKLGNVLDFSNASVGDMLKIPGLDEVEISDISDGVLTLDKYLPSTVNKTPFTVIGYGSKAYANMLLGITSVLSSPNMFPKYKFDKSLDTIDQVLASAMSSSSQLSAGLNRARTVLSELLSMLTSIRTRDDYSANVPDLSLNVDSVTSGYSFNRVDALDRLLDGLEDKHYDRAVALLTSGKITEFFETDVETASYSGAVFSSARAVVNDMPNQPTDERGVIQRVSSGAQFGTSPDADKEFYDTMYEELEDI
jgi:hypothetical protein